MANIKDISKNPLHPIQMQILTKLTFTPNARFRDLRIKQLDTDHFTYHLNKLCKQKYVTKDNNNLYNLTDKGKKLVGKIDTEKSQEEQFAKRGVLLRAIRKNGNKIEYLVYKRLKQPFYGYVGFHTGKIRLGESPAETAVREFKEETGLTIVDFELVGIYHQRGYKPDGKLLRDIYLYTFNIYKFSGNLLNNKDEGISNMWLTKNEIKKYKTYPDFWATDYSFNWQFLPKYYNKYLKLKRQNRWKNITEQKKVLYAERVKTLNEW